MARLAAALALTVLVHTGLVSVGHAQVRELQEARDAYSNAEYERVVELLENLVGGLVPAVTDPYIVRDARRYLGAAYVLLGREQDARNQFGWLLSDYSLDELQRERLDRGTFIEEVQAVFQQVQQARIAELEAEQDDQDAQRAQREARRQAAAVRLLDLAQSAEVELEVDPLPSFLPFGVGQFYNGDEGLGWLFLVTQGVTFLAASVLTSVYVAMLDQHARALAGVPGVLRVPSEARVAVFTGMWSSASAWLFLALGGIIEARVSFRPTRSRRIDRDIPQDLVDDLQLGVGPGGLVLSGSFW